MKPQFAEHYRKCTEQQPGYLPDGGGRRMSTPQAMPLTDALAVIHQYRADTVVITTMGAAQNGKR